jgi:hypothetical protein
LVESVPDRLGVRAVDACVKLEVHVDRQFITTTLGLWSHDCWITPERYHLAIHGKMNPRIY